MCGMCVSCWAIIKQLKGQFSCLIVGGASDPEDSSDSAAAESVTGAAAAAAAAEVQPFVSPTNLSMLLFRGAADGLYLVVNVTTHLFFIICAFLCFSLYVKKLWDLKSKQLSAASSVLAKIVGGFCVRRRDCEDVSASTAAIDHTRTPPHVTASTRQ